MATDGPGFAAAKVNLTLHVTGQRADGYHELDSLVVFAGVGDHITASPAPDLRLWVSGPKAAGIPTDASNLVLRAATALNPTGTAALRLDKHLPMAAGIGGGSSDAAAALRVLALFWARPLPPPDQVLALVAYVPVCLARRAARMSGIGDRLAPVPPLPRGWLVLANPGAAISTPDIFRTMSERQNPGMAYHLPPWENAADLAGWLAHQRNDLQAPAMALEPAIGVVLQALSAQSGCLFARMSGSGATCFGLFDSFARANAATTALRRAAPGWWVARGEILQAPPWRA